VIALKWLCDVVGSVIINDFEWLEMSISWRLDENLS
jgi:hypothetical protein